jgi:hypothetical protein
VYNNSTYEIVYFIYRGVPPLTPPFGWADAVSGRLPPNASARGLNAPPPQFGWADVYT